MHAISQFDWNGLIDLHQIVKGETPHCIDQPFTDSSDSDLALSPSYKLSFVKDLVMFSR